MIYFDLHYQYFKDATKRYEKNNHYDLYNFRSYSLPVFREKCSDKVYEH